MSEGYIRIKIRGKKRTVSYKIKNFPVYIGSAKAKNVIPLRGDGVDGRHGVFTVNKKKLYYEDLSTKGTRLNNHSLRKEKRILIHGTNALQIGRYKIIVENHYSVTEEIKALSTSKRFYYILASITSIALLVILGFFLFKFVLSPDNKLVITNFNLVPNPIIPEEITTLESISFKETQNIIDTNKISFQLLFEKDGLKIDSVFIDPAENTDRQFPIPDNLISDNILYDTIYVILKPSSDIYDFASKEVRKPFLISTKKKIFKSDGIEVITDVNGYSLKYKIQSGINNIVDLKAEFGDKTVLTGKNYDQVTWTYEKKGNYTFKLTLELENSQSVIFSRRVIIE